VDELERLARRIAAGDADAARRAVALLGGESDPRVVWLVTRSEFIIDPNDELVDSADWVLSSRSLALRAAAHVAHQELRNRSDAMGRRRPHSAARGVSELIGMRDWLGALHAAHRGLTNRARGSRTTITVEAKRLDPEAQDALHHQYVAPAAQFRSGRVDIAIWVQPSYALPDVGDFLEAGTLFHGNDEHQMKAVVTAPEHFLSEVYVIPSPPATQEGFYAAARVALRHLDDALLESHGEWSWNGTQRELAVYAV